MNELTSEAADVGRKASAMQTDTSHGAVPRAGLVLGAGGLVGLAYHAGALTALELTPDLVNERG